MKCRWASLKPGSTAAPCASIIVVCGRRRRMTSRSLPTRRIWLPRMATASAILPFAPAVYTFALWTMMSIGPSVSSRWAPTISPAMSVAATIPTTTIGGQAGGH